MTFRLYKPPALLLMLYWHAVWMPVVAMACASDPGVPVGITALFGFLAGVSVMAVLADQYIRNLMAYLCDEATRS